MDDASEVSDLIRRLGEGDPLAAEAVFADYARRLTRLAENHLSRAVALREDGEDVVQSALRTFFRRHERGDFKLDSSSDLWRLLARITCLKARAKARHHTAGPRDVTLEQGDANLEDIVTREPGVEDAVVLMDQIETLLKGLPPLFREVLERRLQGYNVTDVAAELGVSRQAVYEMLNKLQRRLERQHADGN